MGTQSQRIKASQTESDKARESVRAACLVPKTCQLAFTKETAYGTLPSGGTKKLYREFDPAKEIHPVSSAITKEDAHKVLEAYDPSFELCHVILVNNLPEMVVVGGGWSEVKPILHKIQKAEEMKRGAACNVSTHAMKVPVRREMTLSGTNASFARHLLDSLVSAALPKVLWAMQAIEAKRDEQWHKDLPSLIQGSAAVIGLKKQLKQLEEDRAVDANRLYSLKAGRPLQIVLDKLKKAGDRIVEKDAKIKDLEEVNQLRIKEQMILRSLASGQNQEITGLKKQLDELEGALWGKRLQRIADKQIKVSMNKGVKKLIKALPKKASEINWRSPRDKKKLTININRRGSKGKMDKKTAEAIGAVFKAALKKERLAIKRKKARNRDRRWARAAAKHGM